MGSGGAIVLSCESWPGVIQCMSPEDMRNARCVSVIPCTVPFWETSGTEIRGSLLPLKLIERPGDSCYGCTANTDAGYSPEADVHQRVTNLVSIGH